MEVQYVYNEEGKKTYIMLPVELWDEISHETKLETDKKMVFKPSKYKGVYESPKLKLDEEIKSLRDEWIRV